MKNLPSFYRLACSVFFFVFSLAMATTQASADHFRSGTMSWEPVEGQERTVNIKGQVGWTISNGYIPPDTEVGEVVTGRIPLNFGDGNSFSAAVRVISKNTTTGDFLTEFVSIKAGEEDYTPGVHHTYAEDGDYIVYWGSSARELAENLDSSSWRNETLVNIGGDYGGNTSPVSAVPSKIQVPDNTVFEYDLVALDVDGDDLRFRYGLQSEFFGGAEIEATKPTGLVLNEDGSITWDVSDGELSTDIGDRWQATIMVEDLDEEGQVKSKIPLDFVFIISDAANLPPEISGPEQSNMSVVAGETLEFSLSAIDPDFDSEVGQSPELAAINPPSSNPDIWSADSSSEGDTTTLNLTFNTSEGMAGEQYIVIFQAVDDGDASSTKNVTINVTEPQEEEELPDPTPEPTPEPKAAASKKKSKPACYKPNSSYLHCANAGPESIIDDFVKNAFSYSNSAAQAYVERVSHHFDLVVKVDEVTTDYLSSLDPRVPFPWENDMNTVSEIYSYSAVSAFNGYPVEVLDNPYTVVLHFDPAKLGDVVMQDLRVAFFNPESGRWELLQDDTVLKPEENLVANTSRLMTYFAVAYPTAGYSAGEGLLESEVLGASGADFVETDDQASSQDSGSSDASEVELDDSIDDLPSPSSEMEEVAEQESSQPSGGGLFGWLRDLFGSIFN